MPQLALTTTLLHEKIDQLRGGSPTAEEELIHVIRDRMVRLARRMLQSFPTVRAAADVEDVLQNAYLRLLAALEKVRPASTRDFFQLAAYLVRQELIDLLRRFARRPACSFPGSHDTAAPADGLDAWVHFHQAVEALPKDEREVVSLRFYHGRTQDEIAALVGVDVRTVRRRWGAACRALRDALREELDELFG